MWSWGDFGTPDCMKNSVNLRVAEMKAQLVGYYPNSVEKDVVLWCGGDEVVYTT